MFANKQSINSYNVKLDKNDYGVTIHAREKLTKVGYLEFFQEEDIKVNSERAFVTIDELYSVLFEALNGKNRDSDVFITNEDEYGVLTFKHKSQSGEENFQNIRIKIRREKNDNNEANNKGEGLSTRLAQLERRIEELSKAREQDKQESNKQAAEIKDRIEKDKQSYVYATREEINLRFQKLGLTTNVKRLTRDMDNIKDVIQCMTTNWETGKDDLQKNLAEIVKSSISLEDGRQRSDSSIGSSREKIEETGLNAILNNLDQRLQGGKKQLAESVILSLPINKKLGEYRSLQENGGGVTPQASGASQPLDLSIEDNKLENAYVYGKDKSGPSPIFSRKLFTKSVTKEKLMNEDEGCVETKSYLLSSAFFGLVLVLSLMEICRVTLGKSNFAIGDETL